MDVSIVIPLYNEEASVEPLCAAIVEAMEPLDRSFEAILVDDGSADATFEHARAVAVRDERFCVIKLKRNFGQTAALYAGFERAEGEIVVTMDGDLQNDPDDIGRLLDKLEGAGEEGAGPEGSGQEGYDVVIGWRANRQDRFIYRTLPSRIANWLIGKVSGAAIKDNGCALRAYRAEVIKRFPLYSEMHRLLPTILVMAGVRIAQIEVKHHPRRYGESKYGLGRVYKVVFDLMALKMVMTSAQWPLFGFGAGAVASLVLGGVSLALGLAQGAMQGAASGAMQPGGESMVVYLGVSMLWGALGLALGMFGVLCTLIYARGNLTVEDVLQVDTV